MTSYYHWLGIEAENLPPPAAAAERIAFAWPKSWRQVRDLMQTEGQADSGS